MKVIEIFTVEKVIWEHNGNILCWLPSMVLKSSQEYLRTGISPRKKLRIKSLYCWIKNALVAFFRKKRKSDLLFAFITWEISFSTCAWIWEIIALIIFPRWEWATDPQQYLCMFFVYFSRVGAESPAFFRFFLLLSLWEFAFFARIGYTWNSNF